MEARLPTLLATATPHQTPETWLTSKQASRERQSSDGAPLRHLRDPRSHTDGKADVGHTECGIEIPELGNAAPRRTGPKGRTVNRLDFCKTLRTVWMRLQRAAGRWISPALGTHAAAASHTRARHLEMMMMIITATRFRHCYSCRTRQVLQQTMAGRGFGCVTNASWVASETARMRPASLRQLQLQLQLQLCAFYLRYVQSQRLWGEGRVFARVAISPHSPPASPS